MPQAQPKKKTVPDVINNVILNYMYVYLEGIPSVQALEHTKEMLGISFVCIRDTLKLKPKKVHQEQTDE